MPRVSRKQADLNREIIVEAATRLFRERGLHGISVVDVMAAAGLTHGGFYGNFASKEQLMAEACARAFDSGGERWRGVVEREGKDGAMAAIADAYLSRRHIDHPGAGCTVAALGADVARLAPPVRAAMTAGVKAQIDLLAPLLDDNPATGRARAIADYAAMVGALVLARAVDDVALSDEILATVRKVVGPA